MKTKTNAKLKVATTKTSTTLTTTFTAAKKSKPAPKTEPVAAPKTEQEIREGTLRIVRERSPFWDVKADALSCKWVEFARPQKIGEVTTDPMVEVLVANLGASVSVADAELDSKVVAPLVAYAQQQHRRLGGFLLVISLSLDVPAGKQVEACIKAFLGMLSKHLGFELRAVGRYLSEQGEERVFTRISFGF